MSVQPTPLHVYSREISAEQRTSLSVLAELVPEGARVLDLGCGSGALGRHLHQHKGCVMHGVTLNQAEAELARNWYPQLHVANLEQCDLPALFAGQRYDRIVCADVLEHLSRPEALLAACRDLLHPEGRLLISIPNAAYAGLVAELLQGEFEYRDEGLLDRTHLRFFTRQSLYRFLNTHDWGIDSVDVIQRPLPASEFRSEFDALPPAVSRYLLASPDALTYQFIVVSRPGTAQGRLPAPVPQNARPLFTAALYLDHGQGYDEQHKVERYGEIGELRQTLRFELPDGPTVRRLRLDPADRPGFLHINQLRLLSRDGRPLWEWDSQTDPLQTLNEAPRHHIFLQWPGLAGVGALALLTSEDSWLALPVPQHVLETAGGGCLELDLGWPMSADYRLLAEQVRLSENVQAQKMELLHRVLDERMLELETLRPKAETLESTAHALLQEKVKLQQAQRELAHKLREITAQRDASRELLQQIHDSTVIRVTRPLVHAKMWLERQLGRRRPPPTMSPASLPVPPLPALPHPVDVIVPVYRCLKDTRLCIESALAQTQQTAWRLIVINDASPEPEVTEWLREAAATHSRIVLLENEENLGFVATVNRGMALSADNDVILLNSDTEVANDWIDRLVRAAHGHGRVGTVTPFSNNATICSYPRFCEGNELPPGYDTARMDQLFATTLAGQVLDLPTGHGFCLYIRRDCLREVGLFDVENFGKGYGEENDFCLRAAAAGWRNLHALDTYVLHTGGVSFGASKSAREVAAMEVMRRLHPHYERVVMAFVARDPARTARLQIDLARIASAPGPVILAVMHNRAGGTVRHIDELAAHLQNQATVLTLRPEAGERVLLGLAGAQETFALSFKLPEEHAELLQALRQIGVGHVHYHHLLGHSPLIAQLADDLAVSCDFTAHDFYTFCPQISLVDQSNSYCGEQGLDQCRTCLARQPAPGHLSIEQWRAQNTELLRKTRYLLAPSLDAARRMKTFMPGADVRLAPHTDLPGELPPAAPSTLPLPAPAPLKVVVLGALGAIKGADMLEEVALLAAKEQRPIEFHLLGYAYRSLRTQPKARLSVHGAYQESDLPGLLEWLKPDLAWFPARCPETYSYTLSACLKAGLPVMAPDLGAFPERLAGRPWSWVCAWDLSARQWLDLFMQIREAHFIPGRPPATPQAAPATVPALQNLDYAGAYLEGLADKRSGPDALSLAFLENHLPGRADGLAGLNQQARGKTLSLLLVLRSAPGLRQIAQHIPMAWQRRVKSWLIR